MTQKPLDVVKVGAVALESAGVIETSLYVRLLLSDVRDKEIPSSELNGLASNGSVGLDFEVEDGTDSAVVR